MSEFFIGEALLGEGNEIAHIDVMIGDKNGPVGQAFAAGLTQLSKGHTPLLAVIRPNLPPKPHTLVVPKVTIKNMDQANKIFGPAQAAVAKAVADSMQEGIIPSAKADKWVIVCSVFIHPDAEDYSVLYRYNYGATKLAISRALMNYPPVEKIMYDKDRAVHPIMGFRVPRLWRPPYLQIALDMTSIESAKKVIQQIPKNDRIILEVGTPLFKSGGTQGIKDLRKIAPDQFIVADLKTLDVGEVEAKMAFDATADATVASGLADISSLNKFIKEAQRLGIFAYVDCMGIDDPVAKLSQLETAPDVVILHRGIDTEKTGSGGGAVKKWAKIAAIKGAFKDKPPLVAVAGGIRPNNVRDALEANADIVIVGRYITQSRDIKFAVEQFLPAIGGDIDLFRVYVE